MLTLRSYQADLLSQAAAAWRGGTRRICLVAPTGSGKTVIASHLIARAVDKGSRVVFLAHRRELIEQASSKLSGNGVPHGTITAGRLYDGQQVQVASIPTLARRDHPPPADLVVVDETHHVCAGSWARVMEHYQDKTILGLTATPFRLDGRGLGELYQALVSSITIADLVRDGHLVEPITYTQPGPDLRGVHKRYGEYHQGELADAVDRPKLIGDIVGTWKRLAAGRTTVCFAVSCAHSRHLALGFQEAGIPAAHLDAETPSAERAAVLRRLAEGSLLLVSNVGLLTEGWDLPAASCVICARPTKSRCLWMQMVGRGLRSAGGKADCLVLDHAGNTVEHGFVTDPFDCTLEGLKQRERAPSVRTCPQCCAALPGGTPECPRCGYVWPLRDDRPLPEPEAGDLVRVDPEALRPHAGADEQASAFVRLRSEAKAKGYKPTWAMMKFKAIYGHWPRRAAPCPPSTTITKETPCVATAV